MAKLYQITAAAAMMLMAMPALAVPPEQASDVKTTWDFNEAKDGANITITFNAPTTTKGAYDYTTGETQEGDPLAKIDKIEIIRSSYSAGESPSTIKTYDNPAVGEAITFVDTKPIIWGKMYEYNIYVYNDDEKSDVAYAYITPGIIPGDVTDFVATSERGEKPVTLTFALPTKDNEGKRDLEQIDYYTIERAKGWDEPVEIFRSTEPVTPGQSITYVDRDETLESGGSYAYSVKIFGPYGNTDYGQTLGVKLGLDKPGQVDASKINITLNADNTATVTWQAPTKGMDGGWFDPAKVRYSVYRSVTPRNEFTPVLKEVGKNLSVLTVNDNIEDITEPTEISYDIRVYEEGGEEPEYGVTSAAAICGPDYQLPFEDKFDFAVTEWQIFSDKLWVKEGYHWSFGNDAKPSANEWTSIPTRTGEGGYMYALSAYAQPGDTDGISTHKIDVSKASNPVLSLWYYERPGIKGTVTVQGVIPAGDGKEKTVDCGTISFAAPEGVTEASWKPYSVSMAAIAGNPYARIRLYAEAPADAASKEIGALLIDDLALEDYPAVGKLEATVSDDLHATLTWEAPVTDKVMTGYAVKRDNEKIADLAADALTYVDPTALPDGTTVYTVAALYDGVEAPATVTVTNSNFIEGDYMCQFDSEAYTVSIVRYLGKESVVTVPDMVKERYVTSIKERAFAGNTTLTEVTLSEMIAAIGKEAFDGCQALAKVTFMAYDVPATEENAFRGIAEGAIGVCPTDSYEAYAAAENLKPLDFTGSSAVNGIAAEAIVKTTYYTVDGIEAVNPQAGTLVIRRAELADGRVTVDKVVIR